ncbi:MAG: AAA family ATPase [Chloroflexi bacterium]|nr:AAA family ATPase [Chloroflexota bacterium]
MLLRTAYVRFYRAFNYDYLRKSHPSAKPNPWDLMEDGSFYPYIKIEIDPELTCIVGANESGKSQLLNAIEAALGTLPLEPADFCRYSDYFTVAEEMRLPHFGLHFDDLRPEEAEKVSQLKQGWNAADISSIRVFRTKPNKISIYLDDNYEDNEEMPEFDVNVLDELFPKALRIDAERALPNSVPINYLADGGPQGNASPGVRRSERWPLADPIFSGADNLLRDPSRSQELTGILQRVFAHENLPGRHSTQEDEKHISELNLAFDLLVTIGGIHRSAYEELKKALRRDDEGMANGIVARMNQQLEDNLNLARWWTQDRQFRLAIALRDRDLVFTIRDRTGSEYSFAERSDGLKYFLSYLVQFLTHVKDRKSPEILLMDEPDTYLSSQGQQDLLRILQAFTFPPGAEHRGQVVFVTHSPFLIDKNRGDRIRVLDKGAGDEGVRVVRDVGQNHFEPLRTALGSFVGETAFIGNCNVVMEGMADQVYLAGMSDILKREDSVPATDCLDLNRVTLVPAGSASHIPYMVYLARGRDADQPAIIVLLDGDEEGKRAAKALQRGGPRRKQLLPPQYVAAFGSEQFPDIESDCLAGPLEIEDLIPIDVAVGAARRYLREMGVEDVDGFLSVDSVRPCLSDSFSVFEAIEATIEAAETNVHIEKLGFARHVVAICKSEDSESVKQMKSRFAVLFRHLTAKQRLAERERESESISARAGREIDRFVSDTLGRETKADVSVLCERIAGIIDTSVAGDAVATVLRRIRDEFDLEVDRHLAVADSKKLKNRLDELRHAAVHASQPDAGDAP